MTSDPMTPLAAYSKNAYSHSGEDGIIEEILTRIGSVSPAPTNKWAFNFDPLACDVAQS